MGKSNGGQAGARKAANLIGMGGTIHVSGPGFRDKVARGETLRFAENALELEIQISDSSQEQIVEASAILNLEESDIEIKTGIAYGDDLSNRICIEINGKGQRGGQLWLNPAQALALMNVLNRYVTAHDSVAFLKLKQTVKASEARAQVHLSA